MTEPQQDGRHQVPTGTPRPAFLPDGTPAPPQVPATLAAPTSQPESLAYAPPGYAPGYAPQHALPAPVPDPFAAQRGTAMVAHPPQPLAPQTYAPQTYALQPEAPPSVAPQTQADQVEAPQPTAPAVTAGPGPGPAGPDAMGQPSDLGPGGYDLSRPGGGGGRHGVDQWGNLATPRLVPPAPPSRRSTFVLVGVAVALVALVAGFLAVRARGSQPAAAAPQPPAPMNLAAAGYGTFDGPRGLPLAVGTPWGVRCAPVVLALDVDAPADYIAAASEVVDQANGAGVNVAFGDTGGSYDASKLVGAKDDGSNVKRAVVRISTAAPPKDAAGILKSFAWNASLAADGQHEFLTKVVVTIYDRNAGDSDVHRRAAMRGALAVAQGISGSSKPGSGLYSQVSKEPDIFTDNDLLALRTMSGCTP